jgi:hypothetical protein
MSNFYRSFTLFATNYLNLNEFLLSFFSFVLIFINKNRTQSSSMFNYYYNNILG